MANSLQVFPLLATVLCFLSLFGFAHSHNYLFVEGKVYCDTCRTAFVTEVSEYIPGAKVRLECRNRAEGHTTYTLEGETDTTGSYKLPVEGDHEEDICEVVLVKSPVHDCAEHLPGLDRARILITANNGITEVSRYVNPLGFLKKEPLAACPNVLKSMGLLPDAILP